MSLDTRLAKRKENGGHRLRKESFANIVIIIFKLKCFVIMKTIDTILIFRGDTMEEKRRVGRPKLEDQSTKSSTVAFSLPGNIMDEIYFDMESRGRINKSQKMLEIIQYLLDNCPERIENKIPRKKGSAAEATSSGFASRRYNKN